MELATEKTSYEMKELKHMAESVKPGDHIVLHRMYFWSHAIVQEVKGNVVSVIHYSKKEESKKIIEEEVNIANNLGTVYQVKYGEEVKKYNPAELVLARARALIGTEGYDLLKSNCENFATFCKTGINPNQQRKWFDNRMREILHSFWKLANFIFVSTLFKDGAEEMLDLEDNEDMTVARSADEIGAGVIVAFEGGICMWDLGTLYRNKLSEESKGKNLSRKEFIARMVDEISRKFLVEDRNAIGELTNTGSLVCPGLGKVRGSVLGIIGGCVGAAIASMMSINMGEFIAKRKVKPSKTNDRQVDLDDIKPGDHIISYGSMCHPRCHGIVVKVHKKEKQIIIVRYSFEKGVIMDSIYYSGYDPLFKVSYSEDTVHYPADEIVKRAVTAVAENDANYLLLRNNCKRFVYSITLKT